MRVMKRGDDLYRIMFLAILCIYVCNMIWYDMISDMIYDMIYDMIWYDMIWYGMTRHDMTQHDMPRELGKEVTVIFFRRPTVLERSYV